MRNSPRNIRQKPAEPGAGDAPPDPEIYTPRDPATPAAAAASPRPRANELDGRDWTRASISVWSDLRKTREEQKLRHPAMFPAALVDRVLQCYLRPSDRTVLDPFAGSGSALVAAVRRGRRALGFEINPGYADLARARLEQEPGADYQIWTAPASRAAELGPPGGVDLCITSPPYWDVLSRTRTADRREIRDYAGAEGDLSLVETYEEFLTGLRTVFDAVALLVRPGGYCIINVMDLRKKGRFYPLHSDLAQALTCGDGAPYLYDDLIVWDRRADYNSLRPLGYPYVFRINKVHEYLLILRRPG